MNKLVKSAIDGIVNKRGRFMTKTVITRSTKLYAVDGESLGVVNTDALIAGLVDVVQDLQKQLSKAEKSADILQERIDKGFDEK